MLLLESNNFNDYINKYDTEYVLRTYKVSPTSDIWQPLIEPSMYYKALSEFVKYGKFMRFPIKHIYQWMGIIMKNAALLDANSQLVGAGMNNIPTELYEKYFPEIFKKYCPCGYTIDGNMITCADEEGPSSLDFGEFLWTTTDIFNFISAPDGSRGYSDFAIPEIFSIIDEYDDSMPPEKVITIINRVLDVTHENGDLSSVFIRGGRAVLDKISNSGLMTSESNLRNPSRQKALSRLFRNVLREIIREEMEGNMP